MTAKKLLAVTVAVLMCAVAVAQNVQDAQGAQGAQDVQAIPNEQPAPVVKDDDKDKVDHSIRIEATIGIECDDTKVNPVADGSIRLAADYDKIIRVSAGLDIDTSKVDVDSLAIRLRQDRLVVLLDYGKAKPYADDLARSDEKPLAGKSSLATYIEESGYNVHSVGVAMEYSGDKKNELRTATLGVSYDSEYLSLVSGGVSFRVFNELSYVGASGMLFAPSIRGYGSVFMNLDLDWLLLNARCAAGNYLSALDSISIDGILYSSPVWGCADAGLGYRARISGMTCEIWAVGSLYAPAMGQSEDFSGTALAGVKTTLFDAVILRAFGGVAYESTLGSFRLGPDVRVSCSVKL